MVGSTYAFATSSLSTRIFPQNRRTLSTCQTRPHRVQVRACAPPESVTTIPSISAEELSKNGELPEATMSIESIMEVLPHRFPFLLVDRVLSVEAGKRVIAVKNVTVNEPFFPGHFPTRPIMPGVLQVEALAQVGGLALKDYLVGDEQRDFFFGGVDNVRWRRPVVPGDTLIMEVEVRSFKPRFGIAKMSGKAYVNGNVACEADLTLVIDMSDSKKKTDSK